MVNTVKGLIVTWTDPTPLTPGNTLTNQRIEHVNPVSRLMADSIWNKHKSWMVENPTLLWCVDYSIIFRDANGHQRPEIRRAVHRAALLDIGDACLKNIEKTSKAGGEVVEAHFRVECLGNRSATEADYCDFNEVDIDE